MADSSLRLEWGSSTGGQSRPDARFALVPQVPPEGLTWGSCLTTNVIL